MSDRQDAWFVRCARHVSMSDKRSDRHTLAIFRQIRRQEIVECSVQEPAILNCHVGGLEANVCKTGVMCSHLLVLVMRRAAAF